MSSVPAHLPTHKTSITKEEVNQLPLFRYEGTIHLVRTQEELKKALLRIQQEEYLGFDTETRPCFQKGSTYPPSLIQIACSDCVYLITLGTIPFCRQLAQLFGDDSIIKAGVAIGDDIKILNRLYPFVAKGMIDLTAIARRHGLATQGLRTLAANFLGIRVSKGAQCSNWQQKNLSPQQITYAATDAWVSRRIFQVMLHNGYTSLIC